MSQVTWILLLIFITIMGLFYSSSANDPKELSRFWTNTGFAPIGNDLGEIFLSSDTLTNIALISSLPNKALETIRIHWILDLIDAAAQNDDEKYKMFDKFLDELVLVGGMNLGLEFMSHKKLDWNSISYGILVRYTKRYGLNVTSKWKLETWNEPDLKSYNVLNFSLNDYLQYIQDLQNGIKKASQMLGFNFNLRGPAGLFRSKEKHPFCWKIIEMCEEKCPFEVITFHRKGNGTAESIFTEGISLIISLSNTYPRLSQMKFANDEADPIVTWSEPRTFQADINYAATIIETILFHWSGIYSGIVNIESISHDNAFLSFYPNQFTQRTLLARFQINDTVPNHTQFIQKPVFTALGMLGNLGVWALDIQRKHQWHGQDVIYLSTIGNGRHFYLATILVFRPSKNYVVNPGNDTTTFRYVLPRSPKGNTTVWYVVEGLFESINDPYHYWKENGSPAYPNPHFRDTLQKLQVPLVLDHGKKNTNMYFDIPVKTSNTSVILVRACEETIPHPEAPQNVRIKEVTRDEVLILWSDSFYHERCILTYQILFRPVNTTKWTDVTKDRHVPFLNFQYRGQGSVKTTKGCYKVRSIDIMTQKSQYSGVKCIF